MGYKLLDGEGSVGTPSGLRMAIAHEWIAQRAGSEKTFEQMAQTFPEADLFTLSHAPGVELEADGRTVATSPLLDRRLFQQHRAVALPFMPAAWRAISRETYDVVLTSSHACAKGFGPGRSALHLCYVHAPMRYAWNADIDDRIASRIDYLAPGRAALRRWDVHSVSWVDSFAANSTAVADRIEKYYGRRARVIPPPVEVGYFSQVPTDQSDEPVRGHLLSVGRFVSYKKHDLAIRVAGKLSEPLVVAGSGSLEAELRELAETVAPGLVTFAINPSQAELRHFYRQASALIFAANEDFGIVPVEAQAAGCPVVGLSVGGAVDTVIPGVTGILADEQSVESFAAATATLLDLCLEPGKCLANARQFEASAFRSRIDAWTNEILNED